VTLDNPPLLVPGMVGLRLDKAQHLRELLVVPARQREASLDGGNHNGNGNGVAAADGTAIGDTGVSAGSAVSDHRLFQLAGLIGEGESITSRFVLLDEPSILPPFPADAFSVYQPIEFDADAQVGSVANIDRIEVARMDGQVVFFYVAETGTMASHTWPTRGPPVTQGRDEGSDKNRDDGRVKGEVDEKEQSQVADKGESDKASGVWDQLAKWKQGFISVFSMLIIPVCILLSWRNAVLGRCDKRVAWRVALFLFCVSFLTARLLAGFTLVFLRESIQMSVATAFLIWVHYLALEPITRKFWPGILTAWIRAMTGRWRDPSLGQGILVGATAGALHPVLFLLLLPGASEISASTLSGPQFMSAEVLGVVRFVMLWLGYITINLVLFRIAVKRNWLAAVLASLLLISLWHSQHIYNPSLFWILLATYYGTIMCFLIRFGLIAAGSFMFCNHLLAQFPITNDWIGPDVSTTVFVGIVVLIYASFGFYNAVGGRSFFTKLVGSKAPGI
jgi:hypothetical protein